MSVIKDTWDYNVDFTLEKKSFCEFEATITSFKERLLPKLKDGFKVQTFVYNNDKRLQNHDDELKELGEKNRILRNQIETKINELQEQKLQYETYKKDQKLITQEIKETHEAFLMAKKYYKKFLKMYHTIESSNGDTQTIFLQFFTEAKRDSENYSVRLSRNSKTGNYHLISTSPKLTSIKELQRKLQETNDVPGALCSIRCAFMALKSNKK